LIVFQRSVALNGRGDVLICREETTQPTDMVLDLSCRPGQRASFSPPPTTMTSSSLRPEVETASRGRRHNRKLSSSVSVATGGRHDDHDNPLCWSVRDVIEFVSEVPGCQAYAEVLPSLHN